MAGSFPAVSLASTWVEVATNDSMTAEVDRESLRRKDSKVKVWVRWEYEAPADVAGAYPKKTFQSLKSLAIYDCSNRTNANLQELFYADKNGGRVVHTNVIPEAVATNDELAPDSMGEAILRFVCEATSRKKK